jgi:hypothetical protein
VPDSQNIVSARIEYGQKVNDGQSMMTSLLGAVVSASAKLNGGHVGLYKSGLCAESGSRGGLTEQCLQVFAGEKKKRRTAESQSATQTP